MSQCSPQEKKPTSLTAHLGSLSLLLGILAFGSACSRQANTAATRGWQAFTTRYNVLYNAREAYEASYRAFVEATREDYSERLYLDPLALRLERGEKAGDFTRAIEKAEKAIREHSITRKPQKAPGWRRDPEAVRLEEKTEYNPALSEAWLLLGSSYLYEGRLGEARSTFEDISRRYATEPEVREIARLWLVRLATLFGDYLEAEEELRRLEEGGATAEKHAPYLYHQARAELSLAQGREAEALPHLSFVAGREKHPLLRSRLLFLLGQVEEALGHRAEAERAFARAERTAPLPPLELAAHLRRLALGTEGDRGSARLRALTTKRRYAPYQDEVYLALAGRYLAEGLRAEAKQSLRLAVDSSQQKGHAWATAWAELGLMALEERRYPEAHDALALALPVLSPNHPYYPRIKELLPGLQLLREEALLVRRSDSLLHLAGLTESARLAHIDSLIDRVRSRRRSSLPERNYRGANLSTRTETGGGKRGFYFDDPRQVAEGRQRFLDRWGDRPLTDDWNRARRTPALDPLTGQANAPLPEAEPSTEEGGAGADSLDRAFYLRALPLTREAKDSLSARTATALYKMAGLLSERLELLSDADLLYTRLIRDYPLFPEREEAHYRHLLLALRQEQEAKAEELRRRYVREFPSSPRASLLGRADYLTELRQLDTLSGRLYDEAWISYRAGEREAVRSALDRLHQLPMIPEDLRPKVLLLSALSEASAGREAQLERQLSAFVEQNPREELLPYVSLLLEGLRAGRELKGWSRPPSPEEPSTMDSVTTPTAPLFLPAEDGEVPSLVLLYPEGEIQPHEVYFALKSFGYSTFTQWALSVEALPPTSGLTGYLIRGFRSQDEVATYRRRAEEKGGLLPLLPQGTLLLPLTEANRSRLSGETLKAYLSFLSARP